MAAGTVDRGVAVCGSGVGASVCANKIPGVRAGLVQDHYSAHQGVEHDDMNILCMGGRVVGPLAARDLVDAFLPPASRARHGTCAGLEKWLRSRSLKELKKQFGLKRGRVVEVAKELPGRR